MGWGDRTDHPAGTGCCRVSTDPVCAHGHRHRAGDATPAEVHDLTARLELSEVNAAPMLAWVPAARAVRRFATAETDLSAAERDEIGFLAATITHQLGLFDLDPCDGRSGAAALGVVLAAHAHAELLVSHGRLDPAVHHGVSRVLVATAIALAGFAPTEVRQQ